MAVFSKHGKIIPKDGASRFNFPEGFVLTNLSGRTVLSGRTLIYLNCALRSDFQGGRKMYKPLKSYGISFLKYFALMLWRNACIRFSPSLYRCFTHRTYITPIRTLSISGLKSRVLKLSFLSLKMMAKSGLEFILKFTEPLQRYLLSCQANSAILGRYFCTGQQQL